MIGLFNKTRFASAITIQIVIGVAKKSVSPTLYEVHHGSTDRCTIHHTVKTKHRMRFC